MRDIDCDWCGNPRIQTRLFGGKFVVIDGLQYNVARRSRNKMVVKKAGAFFGEKLVLKRSFLSGWKARKKGWLD